MTWQYWIVVAWMVIEIIVSAATVGKVIERTPSLAAYGVATWLTMIGLILWGAA